MLSQLLQHITGFFLPKTDSVVVSERRRLVRVRCHLPVEVVYKEQSLGGHVLDMGSQGLRLRIDSSLPAGSLISARALLSGQTRVPYVNFKVLWSRPRTAKNTALHGIAFDRTEDIKKSWVGLLFRELGLNEKTASSRRKYLRVDGRIPVRLLAPPTFVGAPPPIEMVNVGVGGLLLRSKQPLQPGQTWDVVLGPLGSLPQVGPYPVEIISTKPDETGLNCLAAMRFRSVDNALLQNVGRYVVKLLRN